MNSHGVSPGANNIVLAHCFELAQAIRREIGKAVVGQQAAVDQILVALLAGGHVMIEGAPGIGKTLLVRALAKAFNGQSARVQFTPDLMPSDILGHVVVDMPTGQIKTRRGPVFTHLLIADEINRAPAKTQAAMLEVMQEQQVTLDGCTMSLDPPFMTLATQNPMEHEGTYPLPDAQLDRFLLKICMSYPNEKEEKRMVAWLTHLQVGDALCLAHVTAVAEPKGVLAMQRATAALRVSEPVVDYAVRIARATRQWPGVSRGAGPRGSLALIRAARAVALLYGRDFVLPDDVKCVVLPALRHRVMLHPELELDGQHVEHVLGAILDGIEAPRQ